MKQPFVNSVKKNNPSNPSVYFGYCSDYQDDEDVQVEEEEVVCEEDTRDKEPMPEASSEEIEEQIEEHSEESESEG